MNRIFLFWLVLATTLSSRSVLAQTLQILQSTAVMDLSWDATTDGPLTLSQIYTLERDTAAYLLKVLKENDALGDDHIPLSVSIAAREQTISDVSGRRTVDAVVTCIHSAPSTPTKDESSSSSDMSTGSSSKGSKVTVAVVIDLDTTLMQITNPADLPLVNSRISFRPFENTIVLEQFQNNIRTVADISLIASTVILSLMLLLISSVFLYVTGGWAICWQKCNNCLFEEIDEDEYMMDNKSTFQVNSMYETDEPDDDAASIETGLQTNPTGILGAEQDDQIEYEYEEEEEDENMNPAAGMGIQTPAHRSYEMQDETPISMMTESNRPLGISSMPPHMHHMQQQSDTPNHLDYHDDSQKGGLAHMIMERLQKYGQN